MTIIDEEKNPSNLKHTNTLEIWHVEILVSMLDWNVTRSDEAILYTPNEIYISFHFNFFFFAHFLCRVGGKVSTERRTAVRRFVCKWRIHHQNSIQWFPWFDANDNRTYSGYIILISVPKNFGQSDKYNRENYWNLYLFDSDASKFLWIEHYVRPKSYIYSVYIRCESITIGKCQALSLERKWNDEKRNREREISNFTIQQEKSHTHIQNGYNIAKWLLSASFCHMGRRKRRAFTVNKMQMMMIKLKVCTFEGERESESASWNNTVHLSLSCHIIHTFFIHIFDSDLVITLRKVCRNERHEPIFFAILASEIRWEIVNFLFRNFFFFLLYIFGCLHTFYTVCWTIFHERTHTKKKKEK